MLANQTERKNITEFFLPLKFYIYTTVSKKKNTKTGSFPILSTSVCAMTHSLVIASVNMRVLFLSIYYRESSVICFLTVPSSLRRQRVYYFFSIVQQWKSKL
jgi:hypothetical protein